MSDNKQHKCVSCQKPIHQRYSICYKCYLLLPKCSECKVKTIKGDFTTCYDCWKKKQPNVIGGT